MCKSGMFPKYRPPFGNPSNGWCACVTSTMAFLCSPGPHLWKEVFKNFSKVFDQFSDTALLEPVHEKGKVEKTWGQSQFMFLIWFLEVICSLSCKGILFCCSIRTGALGRAVVSVHDMRQSQSCSENRCAKFPYI